MGHIDEDCITEMAVAFKQSRQRTIQLVSEVLSVSCDLLYLLILEFISMFLYSTYRSNKDTTGQILGIIKIKKKINVFIGVSQKLHLFYFILLQYKM